jgi:hypothetical protein
MRQCSTSPASPLGPVRYRTEQARTSLGKLERAVRIDVGAADVRCLCVRLAASSKHPEHVRSTHGPGAEDRTSTAAQRPWPSVANAPSQLPLLPPNTVRPASGVHIVPTQQAVSGSHLVLRGMLQHPEV